MEGIRQASLFQLFGLLVGVAPLALGLIFAIRPSEQRLSLMRPLSLAAIFFAISSLLLGLINGLLGAGGTAAAPSDLAASARALAVALVPSFVGFACLAAAWLCVAVGMRKP